MFSLLMGHLKYRDPSTVQSQEDVYLSAAISFPSMCEGISVPMEDHVCHGNKDCYCFEVLTEQMCLLKRSLVTQINNIKCTSLPHTKHRLF